MSLGLLPFSPYYHLSQNDLSLHCQFDPLRLPPFNSEPDRLIYYDHLPQVVFEIAQRIAWLLLVSGTLTYATAGIFGVLRRYLA